MMVRGGFSDVQQPVSAQLPICMTTADKRIISILFKKKKKVIISVLRKICMLIADLCCISAL